MPHESRASSTSHIPGFIAVLRRTGSTAFADDDTGEIVYIFDPQAMRLRIPRLQRIVPAGVIDIDRPHLDVVLSRVAHDLGGRIETHGLAVEQRRSEYVGIVALHPGGGIYEQRETRGVTFRKPVFAETFDLAEAALGEVARVAPAHHAFDQLIAKIFDGTDAAESRHGTAQLVGLGGRKARSDDRDAHCLFLEQRHAERLAKHLFKLIRITEGRGWRGILDLLQVLPAPQIGMHHIALDRPRAHDRNLDDQIVKRVWLEPRQHRHLGAALDLEHADRVGARQHAIDRWLLRRNGGEREVFYPSPACGGG